MRDSARRRVARVGLARCVAKRRSHSSGHVSQRNGTSIERFVSSFHVTFAPFATPCTASRHPRPRALYYFLAPRDDRARVPCAVCAVDVTAATYSAASDGSEAELRDQQPAAQLRGERLPQAPERDRLKRHRLAHRGGARGVAHVQVPAEHRDDAALAHDHVGRELAKPGDALANATIPAGAGIVREPRLRDFVERL